MAIKSQTTQLKVSTASAATKTITGITAASPPVVTSATHGYSDGDIVFITGVVGMTEVNDRAFVVSSSAAGTYELKGVDATLYTAYSSGGTSSKQTMTSVSSVSSVQGFDGQAAEIDVTHLRSSAKEYLVGLQDFGNVTLGLLLITDTGQTKLRTLKESATPAVFTITLSDTKVAAFYASVKQLTFSAAGPDTAVTGQATLRVTGAPAWFA